MVNPGRWVSRSSSGSTGSLFLFAPLPSAEVLFWGVRACLFSVGKVSRVAFPFLACLCFCLRFVSLHTHSRCSANTWVHTLIHQIHSTDFIFRIRLAKDIRAAPRQSDTKSINWGPDSVSYVWCNHVWLLEIDIYLWWSHIEPSVYWPWIKSVLLSTKTQVQNILLITDSSVAKCL